MKRTFLLSLSLVIFLIITPTIATAMPAAPTPDSFICGDANTDGNVNVLDVITIVNFIMGNTPSPFSLSGADVNANGSVDVLDVISVINMIMQVSGLPCPCVPKIVDADGNNYTSVKIGDQCWMKENLKVTKYSNSVPISYPGTDQGAWSNNVEGAYAWYANDIQFKNAYGALYNWFAVRNTNKLCPAGWRTPNMNDWNQLRSFVELTSPQSGNQLKSCRQVGSPQGGSCNTETHPRWDFNQTHFGTDNHGFSALPGGFRFESGVYGQIGAIGTLWAFDEFDLINAQFTRIFHTLSGMGMGNGDKKHGYSVRCIRGEAQQVTLPAVITKAAENVTTSSATIGGRVTNDGGATVTERGIYWSTASNPQTSGTKLPMGSGIGNFSTSLGSLSPNTPYYYVAYAKNSAGIAFGNTESFTTENEPGCANVTDFDGNIYPTVIIGSQCWMAQNLRTTHYKNGSAIFNITDPFQWSNRTSGAYAWYDNNPNFKETLGALYNGHAIKTNLLCPQGWRVPTNNDLNILFDFLGDPNVAGGKLKEEGTAYWDSPNVGATNETGFSARAGGIRETDGFFTSRRTVGWFWTSTQDDPYSFWGMRLAHSWAHIEKVGFQTLDGASIRCIKGEASQVFYPTAITNPAASITYNSATLGGNITDDGGAPVTERGIIFGTDVGYLLVPNHPQAGTSVVVGSGQGEFSTMVTGLDPATTYFFVAFATNSYGTTHGTVREFTTPADNFDCGTSTIADVDGNIYNTVQIGSQCWMAENLKTTKYSDGTPIDFPVSNSEWSNNTSGAYTWFDNNVALKDLYGALYNFYAVVNFDGLCPEGWHVPDNSEWTILDEALGGWSVSGGKLKSTRTSPNPHPRWDLPNTGASNTSGFTGYPGGYRHNDARFLHLGYSANWWSSTMTSATIAKYFNLGVDYVNSYRGTSNKANGFSVRCVKD